MSPHKRAFLSIIQSLSKTSFEYIKSSEIIKFMPGFTKECLYILAFDLAEEKLIRMQNVGYSFDAQLTSNGRDLIS